MSARNTRNIRVFIMSSGSGRGWCPNQSHATLKVIPGLLENEVIMIRFLPMGDQALHVMLGEQIDDATHQRVVRLHQQVKKYPILGVTEWVPTYQAITFFYSPKIISYEQLCAEVEKRWLKIKDQATPTKTRLIDIPVLYGDRFGFDLEEVAAYHQLDPEEVINIHTQPTYRVYMIGFTPGFPYLGGMSQRIATPRKKNPRHKVPSGSVGIADQQTGIYSLATPGGWNIIGRTPIKLFDPKRNPPILLKMGDQIRFYRINYQEFQEIEEAIQNGEYSISISVVTQNEHMED